MNDDENKVTTSTIAVEFEYSHERRLDAEQLHNLECQLIQALQDVRALLGKPPVIVPNARDWGRVGE